MTNHPNVHGGTLFDLPFETARERIVGLQASASPGPAMRSAASTSGQPPMRRLRSALGSRLIEVGKALMADDRRPATRT